LGQHAPVGRWCQAVLAPEDAALTVADGGIDIDFAGTSPMVGRGVNVPMIYTEAMASFGVRSVVGGGIPNNAGSLRPVGEEMAP